MLQGGFQGHMGMLFASSEDVFLGPRTEIWEMCVQPQQIRKPDSPQRCFAVGRFLTASLKGV